MPNKTPISIVFLLIVFASAGHADTVKAIKTQVNPKFSSTGTGNPAPSDWAKGRLLVIPRAGLSEIEFGKATKPYGVKSKHKLKGPNAQIYELPDGADEIKVLNILKKDRRFKAVELDRLVEPTQTVTDPAFSNSWALPKIEAPTAWQITVGDGITIAILDTGVNGNHPDLAANMVPGWNMHDNNADTTDIHGHGTLVAGSAAAVANNGHGSVGVAWGARIMPVRIARPDGRAYLSTMAQAIRWAADNGAQVANISYGGADSPTVQSGADYMRNKGGMVVMSAGNSGGQLNYPPSNSLIVTSATDSNDERANWSSYGPYVDLAAPGVRIYTTNRNGGYSYASGTSFSSPIVAATAALILSANPNLAPTDVDQILKSTAVDLEDPGFDQFYGHGRIDAARAVKASRAQISVDNIPPAISIVSPIGGEVSGNVLVDVGYSDNKGVVRVELHINNKSAITDTQAPFAFAWDTTQLSNGTYTLTAHAFDTAGNQGASSPVVVAVKNSDKDTEEKTSPEITHFNLSDGMKVRRYQNIRVTASEDTEAINLSVNGNTIVTRHSNSLSYRWNTWNSAPRGSLLYVMVEAINAAGKATNRTVKVRN